MYEEKFVLVAGERGPVTGRDPAQALHPTVEWDIFDRHETTFRLLAAAYAVATVLLAAGLCLWTDWNSHRDTLDRFTIAYLGSSIVLLLIIVLLLSPLLPQLVRLITGALPDGPLRYIVLSMRQDGHARTDILDIRPDGRSDLPPRGHYRTWDTEVCDTVRSWMRDHRDDLAVSTRSGTDGQWDTYLLRCRRRDASWDLWQTLSRWRLDHEAWHRDRERQKAAVELARIEAEEQRRSQARRDALDRL